MDAVSDSPAPVSPGEQLAAARERQGLSRAEVAQRLHMSPSQVEALESGHFERLPRGTFLRGFIRNYAKLVGVDSEPLVAGLAQATPAHATPGIVVPSQNIRFEPLHERISASPYWKGGVIGAVVLAFGAAALYWWAEIRNAPVTPVTSAPAKPQTPPQQIAAAPLPAAETPPPTEAPKVEAAPAEAPKVEAPKVEAPKGDIPAKPASASAAKPSASPAKPNETAAKPAETAKPVPPAANTPAASAAPAGSARLAFKFRGDSWVEVKDASGKVVFSRLNTAGSEAEVTGKRPLTVIVGNAPDVTMLYNDRDFPLEPHTKVAVARFTVE